jgi:branched-chain amino acid aminotransferase
VYVADEAFFTGTAVEVMPIRELDRRAIGTGKPGPVTQKLQAAYFDIVRNRSKPHGEWLSFV